MTGGAFSNGSGVAITQVVVNQVLGGISRPRQGWIDDLRFYVLFDSISVISGRWEGDKKYCV